MPSAAEIETMSGPELVRVYNAMRTARGVHPIKKFRTLADGRRIVAAAAAALDGGPVASVVRPSEAETAAAPPPITRRSKKSHGTEDDYDIVILSTVYGTSKRSTGARDRWEKMVRSKIRTLKEYCEKIGTVGDLRWWADEKKIIALKKRSSAPSST